MTLSKSLEMNLIKDKNLLELLERLELDARHWIIVDHWDALLGAVGIAHKSEPRRLVYISLEDEDPNHYYYECEVPIGPELTDYSSIDSGEHVSFERLLSILEHHLVVKPGAV